MSNKQLFINAVLITLLFACYTVVVVRLGYEAGRKHCEVWHE